MSQPPPHDGHGHAHVHAGPTHDLGSVAIRALQVGLALTAGFAIVEAIGGYLSGSLALISDAGHMATDAASFVVALIAQYVARRPPSAGVSGRGETTVSSVSTGYSLLRSYESVN